jgi:hypothetical protein
MAGATQASDMPVATPEVLEGDAMPMAAALDLQWSSHVERVERCHQQLPTRIKQWIILTVKHEFPLGEHSPIPLILNTN